MTSVEEIIGAAGSTLYSELRARRRARPERTGRSVYARPLDATEWRLQDYDFLVVRPHVAQPISLDGHDASLDVRVLWNTSAPAHTKHVVMCLEYAGQFVVEQAAAYERAGVPSHQIVIVGDLRTMPVREYSVLAQHGVFLKHIRYADAPVAVRRQRVEEELRLVYRGLLGRIVTPPHEDRPRTYEYPSNRISEDELAALVGELRR